MIAIYRDHRANLGKNVLRVEPHVLLCRVNGVAMLCLPLQHY